MTRPQTPWCVLLLIGYALECLIILPLPIYNILVSCASQVQQSAQALCANGQGHGLDSLLRVLHLVDLVIDTFEYPFGNPGQYHRRFKHLQGKNGMVP